MTSTSPLWPAGEPWTLDLPEGTMTGVLARAAASAPRRVAISYYGAEFSYAELWAKVEALAAFLREACGVQPGDRVAVAMQNSPQYVIAYHAALRADAVCVPCSPMSRTRELAHILADSGARTLLLGEELIEAVAPLMGERLDRAVAARYADMAPDPAPLPLPAMMRAPRAPLPVGPGWISWTQATAPRAPLPPARAGREDLCLLPYTSGTTGAPKACRHVHHALLFTAALQARWYGLGPDDVMTGFMPLFHVAGMQGSMNAALVAGAELTIMTRWDRELAARLFLDRGVTFWNAAPTMVADVLAAEGFEERAFAGIRVMTGGGAAMPETVARRLRERHGLTFVEGYGMTETMSPTHINPMHAPAPQCLGIAVHETDARVVDPETLAELPEGEVGEIVVSGPQVCRGYHARPEADREAFFERDGKRFLRTGDLGRRDAEGRFRAVDRLKRMINVSGFKVWPAELEAAFHEHPWVRECCIISIPDAHKGEGVKAVITLAPGADAEAAPAALRDWARGRMSAYKVPATVEVAAELPRSASSKIDWRSLQEREWADAP